MRKYYMGVAVLLVLLAGVSTSKAQSVVNGGFETGNFTGWTVTGTSPNFGVGTAGTVITGTYPPFGTTTVVVNSGTYAGYAAVCNTTSVCQPSGGSNDYLDLSQVISVVPGDTYTAGLYVAAYDAFGDNYGSNIGISIDGTPIFVNNASGVSPTYQFFNGTFSTLDPNPTITFHINGSGFGDAGFSFDDLSVTGPPVSTTPEPQSLVLFATGLLGIFSRLKRTAIS